MGPKDLNALRLADNNFAPTTIAVDNRLVVLELSPGLWLDRRMHKAFTP